MEINIELSKSKQKQIIINNAIEEYINTPLLDRSIKGISKKYGINQKTLSKYLKLKGIPIKNIRNSSNFNTRFFQNIDTEEKAYWLGFMYADGWVSSSGNTIGLGISLKDIDHLKKYNQALNYKKGLNVTETHQFGDKTNHKNKNGEIMYMVSTQISNDDLRSDLINAGCIPNKSLVLKFPDINIFKESDKYSKEELIIHFIRGYFDGDGSLGLYQHSKTNINKEESLMFVGTKQFLENVQKYLGNGFLIHKSNCNLATYRLSYSTQKAFNVAHKLYNNATVYLKRKYDIYLNFCHHKLGKNGED